jgi:SAM-dependent methyltransferase
MIDRPVSFAEYLEAKFDLDERSFNREVREAFWQALGELPDVECLDVGAGTGATARRLLRHVASGGLAAPLSLTALDRDPALLDLARKDAAKRLRALGTVSSGEAGELRVEGSPTVAIRFLACELDDYRRDEQLCNLITAHAFLDIVPLAQTLRSFSTWLQPGGYLYASLNYDGDTALLPMYQDENFEATLLRHYDDSMERRRVGALATGGAHCGRRLHRLLPEHGFDILACGSSDWNITPFLGEYRGSDARCLRALLDMIGAEGQGAGLFDGEQLAHWHKDRMRLLREGRLGMIVHQLDLLARYDP